MIKGCVRAWNEEEQRVIAGELTSRHQRALFRRDFVTAFREVADEDSTKIKDLKWGDTVELLDWPSGAAPWHAAQCT